MINKGQQNKSCAHCHFACKKNSGVEILRELTLCIIKLTKDGQQTWSKAASTDLTAG